MITSVMTGLLRVRAAPLLLRLLIWLVGLAALLMAVPGSVRMLPATVAVLAVVASVPAAAPAGPWPTLLVLGAAAGWAAGTDFATAGIWPVVTLAGLLYLLHTLAALAAALPFDALIAPDAVGRWLARAVGVVAGAGLLIGVVLAGVPWVAALLGAGGGVHAGATLAGLALAVAAATVLRLLFDGRS